MAGRKIQFLNKICITLVFYVNGTVDNVKLQQDEMSNIRINLMLLVWPIFSLLCLTFTLNYQIPNNQRFYYLET